MKKNLIIFIVAIITLLMATMFIGCSSTTAEKETTGTETVVVKEEASEIAEAKDVESKPTPEPTAKPAPKPTPKPIVYEGIDMESTLPGEEWLLTFEGIITEPKFVIFNDETNKKVIVEEKEKVILEVGDYFVVYNPNEESLLRSRGIKIKDLHGYGYYDVILFDEEYFTKTTDFMVELGDGTKLSCTINPEF